MSEIPRVRLSAAEQGFRWLHHITSLLDACAAEHGDRFALQLAAYGTVVVVSHPDDIGAVFAAPDPGFSTSDGRGVFSFFSSGSTLNRTGADHRANRRRIAAALAGARLETVAAAAAEVVAAEVTGLVAGDGLDVTALGERVAAESAARLLFGRPVPALAPALAAVLSAASPALAMGATENARLCERTAQARAIVAQELASGPGPEPSVLGACQTDGLGAPDPDDLLTLASAAMETTAVSFTWLLVDLLTASDAAHAVRERLVSALAQEDTPALLEAAVRESLRLHPPIPAILTVLPQGVRGRDLALPPGAAVAPSPWLAHRRAAAWPDPLRFDPDRHLGRAAAPWTWIPFGGGARRCLGEAVAMSVIQAATATLLRRRRLGSIARRPASARRFIAIAPAGRVRVPVLS